MLTSRPDKSGFETRLGPTNALVTLGGYAEKVGDFRPEVHAIIHDGEFFINVRKPTINRVDKPELIDGRAEAICDGLLESFRVTPDGEVEWDTIYSSLPSSPEIIKEVTDSGNVSYHKQIITPEEALQGARYNREENVGCIVAYGDKRDNKYQTGKLWQYCRSKLYDAKGNTAWSTIEIYPDGRGKWFLVETLPWEWMKRAIYPVLKDPIIGYPIKGALLVSFSNSFAQGYGRYVSPFGGPVTAIHGYFNTAVNVKIGLYKCNPTNSFRITGQALYARGDETLVSAGGVLTTFPVTNLIDIVLGDTYSHIVVPQNNVSVYYDSVSVSGEFWNQNYAIDPRDPAPATTNVPSSNFKMSIWSEGGPTGKIPQHLFKRVR